MNKYLLAAGIIALMSVGCASTKNSLNGATVAYLDDAKQNFDKGEEALSNGQYEEALSFFEHVRSKYPYSKYAALSDVKIGDMYFAQSKWFEAADAYEFFVKFHPRHEQLPYALFQIAKSYYEARPSEFFLIPRSYTKDSGATQEALKSVDQYLAQCPTDEKVPQAKEMRGKLLSDLAQKDFYVGNYYEAREKWSGAMYRFERVAELYPEVEIASVALLKAARAAEALGQPEKEMALLGQLVEKYAKSSEAKEAQSKLLVLAKEPSDSESD